MIPNDPSGRLVERKAFTTREFRLENGAVLPEITIAYESYGRLADGGRNAILVTHGFTNSQHAAGRYSAADLQPGWWGDAPARSR